MRPLFRAMVFRPLTALLLAAGLVVPIAAVAQNPSGPASAHNQLAREIFQELIEIDTTHATGSTTDAAEAMASRLRAAGFPAADVQVIGPHPKKGNLVARFRGSGDRRPLLLLAHLDVVGANREDWSLDPFRFTEQDGYFYGRGTTDDKAMSAIWIASLIRYKQEGLQPDRDIIVALTADEEGGDFNGVDWLLQNHRGLIDAAYALNEGGFGTIRNGKYMSNDIQLSEKVYMTLRLEVINPGGHSSIPERDNAIYHLAEGLSRLAQFEFPVRLDEITRTYFERMAEIEGGSVGAAMKGVAANPPDPEAAARLSEVPYYNALLRSTCVATQLEAGHAENALPQTARATVNCRVLPGDSADEVRQTVIRVLADEAISVSTTTEPMAGPASPLDHRKFWSRSSASPGRCGGRCGREFL